MSFLRMLSYDAGRIAAAAAPGDTVSLGYNPTAISNAAGQVITGAAIGSGIILRQTAGAGVTDTSDTAVNIAQALYGNTGSDIRVGECFTVKYSNQTANAVTLAAGVGVTASGNLTAAANAVKEIAFVCTFPGVKTFLAGVYTNVGAAFNMIAL